MNQENNFITSITKKSPKDKKNILIYSNENLLCETLIDVIFKLNIKKGDLWNDELKQKIKRAEDEINSINIIRNKLLLSARTIYEIRTELEKKQIQKDVIEYLIEDFKNRGVLNDEVFAKVYVRDCLKFKDYGPNKVKYELQKKGVAQNIIDKEIMPLKSEQYQKEKIYKLLRKKIGGQISKNEVNEKLRNKALNFILSRGFDEDFVNDVLSSMLD